MADPQKERILAVMKADLGIERMEELAQDDPKKTERRLNFSLNSRHANPEPVPRPQTPSQIPNKWNTAKFDDEDSRAVGNLDPIENGRLHALNRAGGRGQERDGRHNGFDTSSHSLGGDRTSAFNQMNITTANHAQSSYDPRNPHKSKLVPRARPSQRDHGLPAANTPFGNRMYPVRSPFETSVQDSAQILGQATPQAHHAAAGWHMFKGGPKRDPTPQRIPSTPLLSATEFAIQQRPLPTRIDSGVERVRPTEASIKIHPAGDGTAVVQANSSQLEFLWESDMMAMMKDHDTVESALFPGKLYIYKYPGRMVAILELRWDNGRVVREDSRTLVTPILMSRKIVIRCQDRPNAILRTQHLLLDSKSLADEFMELYKSLKSRFGGSTEPRYPHTEDDTDVKEGNQVDVSTLLPLGGITQDSVLATNVDVTAKENPTAMAGMPSQSMVHVKPFVTAEAVDSSIPGAVNSALTSSTVISSAVSHPSPSRDSTFRLSTNDDVLADMLQELDEQDKNKAAAIAAEEDRAAAGRHAAQASAANVAEPLASTRRNEFLIVGTEQPRQARTEASALGKDVTTGDDIATRCARIETDIATSTKKAATDVLIDISSSAPEPQLTSYSHDLEGIVYEPSTPTAASDGAAGPEVSQATVKDESLEPKIKAEPSDPAESSKATLDEDTFINAANLNKQQVGLNLSRPSLEILSQLGRNNYLELLASFNMSLYWVKEMGTHGTESAHDVAAISTVVMHLARHTAFSRLGKVDRLQTAAVVYSNLKQLKTRRVIKYSTRRLLELRRHARRAEPAVSMVNEYLQATGQLKSSSQTPRATSLRSTQSPMPEPTMGAPATLPAPSLTAQVEEENRPQPPHIRGIGHNAGLGTSRWA